MILTVTLNPALDLTYHVPELQPGHTHRVSNVYTRAGGKGVNVARVLHNLGEVVVAAGLCGGDTGQQLLHLLTQHGVPAAFTPVAEPARRTNVIDDGSVATGLWEPGPHITAAEWATFLASYHEQVHTAAVVVLSGSLPPGLATDTYAQLTIIAKHAGAAVILDADGPALQHGLAARPDVIKPNAAELAGATGLPVHTPAQATHAAQTLRQATATAVVASLGPAGLIAVTGDGCYHAHLPEPVTGNPTGAGDAAVAALAAGLARQQRWPVVLRQAAAVSAAAVARPAAGEFCPTTAQRLHPAVTITRLDIAQRRN